MFEPAHDLSFFCTEQGLNIKKINDHYRLTITKKNKTRTYRVDSIQDIQKLCFLKKEYLTIKIKITPHNENKNKKYYKIFTATNFEKTIRIHNECSQCNFYYDVTIQKIPRINLIDIENRILQEIHPNRSPHHVANQTVQWYDTFYKQDDIPRSPVITSSEYNKTINYIFEGIASYKCKKSYISLHKDRIIGDEWFSTSLEKNIKPIFVLTFFISPKKYIMFKFNQFDYDHNLNLFLKELGKSKETEHDILKFLKNNMTEIKHMLSHAEDICSMLENESRHPIPAIPQHKISLWTNLKKHISYRF